ncbi:MULTISPECIES: TonB-dependent receptor plug domain-containing protein [Acetobacter]|uniref:TonB-dependent receptor plug domain-containing protein n=2 Tax=Acetobacteraceae TaxID=433 RepID=UPI0039EC3C2D
MRRLLLASVASSTCMFSFSALAAAADGGSTDEQVIVTGTRDPHQTARKSVTPVTVISAKQLQATGQPDLRDALVQLDPSITRPGLTSGNGNMTSTISLRGLTSDQTLILINGKRRHSTSIMTDDTGSPENGTTPVDLGMIPQSSIDHIEILQDGAAALYGSDAIAGVVNIILKKNTKGLELHSVDGGYYAGDGFTTDNTVSWGTKLTDRGYFHLDGEFKHQDHTNRGDIDTRVGQKVNEYFGNPQETKVSLGYNMGYKITDKVELYSFGSYAHRAAWSFQNYRTSSVLPQVYPHGFSPVSSLDEDDFNVAIGFRGEIFDGWNWDLSTSYGEDHSHFDLNNSVNTMLYDDTGYTPTHFHVMSFSNRQWTTDFGLRKAFDVPLLAGPINFSIGAQYRNDAYNVNPGDSASYYGAGPQGQSGLNQLSFTRASRDVAAGYIGLSTHLLKNWQVDFAGRFEHYTDSGNTETGKVSMRYDVNKYFALRGGISNGFRAPTLAEQYYTSLSTTPTGANGVVAVNSATARALGSKALRPEKTTNFSAGFLLNPIKNMNITVDAYQITVRHRIVEGGVYNGQRAIDALEMGGYQVDSTVTPDSVSVQYFSNGADTRTRGVNVTAGYRTDFGTYGRVNWDVSLNLNETKVLKDYVDSNGNRLLSAQGIGYLTTAFPRNKLIFGASWHKGKWDFAIHEMRWGHTINQLQYVTGANAWSNSVFYQMYNKPKFQTNVLLGYQATERLHVALGANNLFNQYPSRIPKDTSYVGVVPYDTASQQMGFNGGYYYLALNYSL